MDTKDFTKEVKQAALNAGADLVGIANVERFDDSPPEFHPRNIYPFTKSVVVVCLRVMRGALRGAADGTGRITYNSYGYGGLNENWMKDTLRTLGMFIEDNGYEARPVIQFTGTDPQEPIMDHRIAAVLAGLGEFGYSKVFLTKRFGPLQRIGILLTDAELQPDKVCVNQICDRCMQCVARCPSKAINGKETTTIRLDGNEITYGKLDTFLCGIAHTGAIKETHPEPPDDFEVKDLMAKAKKQMNEATNDVEKRIIAQEFSDEVHKRYPHQLFRLIALLGRSCAMCGAKGCYQACLEHLEEKGVLEIKFKTPFKKRSVASPKKHYSRIKSHYSSSREL